MELDALFIRTKRHNGDAASKAEFGGWSGNQIESTEDNVRVCYQLPMAAQKYATGDPIVCIVTSCADVALDLLFGRDSCLFT